VLFEEIWTAGAVRVCHEAGPSEAGRVTRNAELLSG
jgi:hypothetical protein